MSQEKKNTHNKNIACLLTVCVVSSKFPKDTAVLFDSKQQREQYVFS